MRVASLGLAGLVTSLCVACGTSSSTAPPAPSPEDAGVDASTTGGDDQDASTDDATAGQDTTVVAFDKTHIYFDTGVNQRTVDQTASFPAASSGTFSKITMHLTLACPTSS